MCGREERERKERRDGTCGEEESRGEVCHSRRGIKGACAPSRLRARVCTYTARALKIFLAAAALLLIPAFCNCKLIVAAARGCCFVSAVADYALTRGVCDLAARVPLMLSRNSSYMRLGGCLELFCVNF